MDSRPRVSYGGLNVQTWKHFFIFSMRPAIRTHCCRTVVYTGTWLQLRSAILDQSLKIKYKSGGYLIFKSEYHPY